MKTKHIHIQELIYTVFEVCNIQQEDKLKKVTDEYYLIEDRIYELIEEGKKEEYSTEISRLISTAEHVGLIFNNLLDGKIDKDKCISELILTLKTSIKLIKSNGKITI